MSLYAGEEEEGKCGCPTAAAAVLDDVLAQIDARLASSAVWDDKHAEIDARLASCAVWDEKHAEIDARLASCEREIDAAGEEVKRIEDALQGDGTAYLGMTCPQDKDALLRFLEASQKKEGQLRAEKWQLRESRQGQQRLLQPTAPGGVFVVEATIKGCKRIKGLRPILYLQAEEHFAFHGCPDVEESISYKEDDLWLKLVFQAEESAVTFRSVLTDLNLGQPVRELRGSVKMEIYRKACGGVLARVMRDQYEPNASGLPYATLADMAADSVSTSADSRVPEGTPLFLYQSIEDKIVAQVIGFHKAYIKDKAECEESEKEDHNNLLALSPNMHKCFAGDEYRKGKSIGEVWPSIAIRGGVVSSEEMVTDAVQKRFEVELLIECRKPECFELIKRTMMDGTISDGDGLLRCSVYVEKPEVFKAYLDWRYKRTKSMWEELSS
ncbi:unnamed protein product [Laminaria digitata]